MAVTFFVRRKRVSDSTYEYLFLTAETLELVGDENIIAPMIPGNNASVLDGDGSNNFMVNIGAQRVTIRVTGFILDITSTDYPGVNSSDPVVGSNNRYIQVASNAITSSTTKANQTARDIRHCLLAFWADQSLSGTYSKFELGWPEWGDVDTYEIPTSSGVKYRLFEGMMRQPRVLENAGEVDQYPFSFSWMVGEVGA